MCICYKYVLGGRDAYFYVASIGVCYKYIYIYVCVCVTGMCIRWESFCVELGEVCMSPVWVKWERCVAKGSLEKRHSKAPLLLL